MMMTADEHHGANPHNQTARRASRMGNDRVVVATDLRLRVVDDFDEFLERDAWDEAVLASLDPNPS